MLNRRKFLVIPLGAVLKAAEPSFERIDTHNHIHRSAPELIESLEKGGWRGLSICDSREIGDQPSRLGEMIEGTIKIHRESKGRLAWATTFDARAFEHPEFASRVIAQLQKDFNQDAIAVKIWKNIGMAIRSNSGEYLLPDHPSLLPIYETIQKAGKTLMAHLADPDVAWLPLEGHADAGYFRSHPEWHMFGRAAAPSKPSILAARDRILARLPRLRVIGCHLGSNEEDLEQVAKRLDTYSNFAIDVAARVRYLARHDREKVRQFVLRYQDRIIYATDFSLGTGDDRRAAESLQRSHDGDWAFFASSEMLPYRDRQAQGLALPEPVLRKIFRDNAARWLPGIV
jgi:hypothetical protein